MNFPKINNQEISIDKFIVILINVLLFLLIFFNKNAPFIWDENIFRQNCFSFKTLGLSKEFLIGINEQAPGPLYQIIQGIFSPITGYNLFGMRLVNFSFFLGAEYFVFKSAELFNGKPWYYLLAFLAFPGSISSSTFAMSEMPTYFFLSILVFFIIKFHFYSNINLKFNAIIKAILIGVLIGIVIIGRTHFLMLVPVFGLSIFFVSKNYKVFYLIAIIVSSFFFLPMFLAWGGLVPPKVSSLEGHWDLKSLNFKNALIVSIYFLFVRLLYFKRLPGLLFFKNKSVIFFYIISVISLFFLNIFIFNFHYQNTRLLNLFGPNQFLEVFVFVLLFVFAISIVLIIGKLLIDMLIEKDILNFIFLLSSVLIVFSTIKHQNYGTGARHFGQIFFLLLPVFIKINLSEKLKFSSQIYILIIGICSNLLIILGHYYQTPTILY